MDAAETEPLKNQEDKCLSSDNEIFEQCVPHKNHLFGRQKPVHDALGRGKYADIILWRNKQVTGGIFAGATIIWLLFEWIGYHLLTFICHFLILSLATLFLWSNLGSYFNIRLPKIPAITLSEELTTRSALLIRAKLDEGVKTLREIALSKDVKTFLSVTLVLWLVSIIGSWFDFLTLLYLAFVMALTVPVLYEKNEDAVDLAGEKALIEIKKQYAEIDKKYLCKIPFLNTNVKQD